MADFGIAAVLLSVGVLVASVAVGWGVLDHRAPAGLRPPAPFEALGLAAMIAAGVAVVQVLLVVGLGVHVDQVGADLISGLSLVSSAAATAAWWAKRDAVSR